MIYRVDLHVYSNATEGAHSSIEELVRAARRAGLDAIAITDHDYCTPVPIEMRGVLLIPGCEITTLGGHILGVFLERPIDFTRLHKHGLPTADEAVLEIHRCGGLAILAHPFTDKNANPALFPIRPDAVETISARAALQRSDANEQALLWATAHQRPQVGSSNAYSPAEVGNAYTEIACRRLSRSLLKEALDLGHCRPVSVRDTNNTTCGYANLTQAKRSGNLRSVLLSAASLGICTVKDLIPKMHRPKKKKAYSKPKTKKSNK